MEVEFLRLKNGNNISSVGIPYNTQYIEILKDNFEVLEEYEKCQVLMKILDRNKKMHDNLFIS